MNEPNAAIALGKSEAGTWHHWEVWMLPAFILACWVQAIRHLVPDWTLNEQYHYGWLVPLLALYLVKVRFERCPSPDPPPKQAQTRWIVFSLALCSAACIPLREANVQWRSMGWVLAGLAAAATLLGFWQAGGRRWLRHFVFPVLFFFTAVPLWRQLEEGGMHWLMQHNAKLSVEALHWIGIEAIARGNLITLPSGTLGVDEACSGIRSLQGTLMLSLFLGEILAFDWARRLALLFAGAAWALVTNVARTAALGYIADRRGIDAVEAVHDTAGYTVLLICSLLVGATAWLLHRRAPARAIAPAISIQTSPISARLREVSLPAMVSIGILAASLCLTETWFRIHERSDIPLTPWRFRLPIDRPGFERTKIAARIRADLRFDEGYGGKWRDEAGLRWQALYFRWLPGRNSAQTVGVHDPRACLAAVGMKEVAALPNLDLSRGDIPLPVDAYHFRDGPNDVFVFNCLVEDVRRGETQIRVREDNSISSRFVAALAGKRHRGQRRLEVAVWGTADPQVATTAFRNLIASQIQTGEVKR